MYRKKKTVQSASPDEKEGNKNNYWIILGSESISVLFLCRVQVKEKKDISRSKARKKEGRKEGTKAGVTFKETDSREKA